MTLESLDQKLALFLRRQRGTTTYTQFARKVGLGESTLFRIENGQQSATLRAVQQILKGLRCTYSDIFETPAVSLKVADSKQGPKPGTPTPPKVATYPKAPRKKKR